jgi:hypothetical protein
MPCKRVKHLLLSSFHVSSANIPTLMHLSSLKQNVLLVQMHRAQEFKCT